MTEHYEIFVGPNHPGVTGNFSIHVWLEGDIITKLRPDYGYLHRGFEKLMERRETIRNISLVPRICVPEPDINENLYARVIEAVDDIEVPPRAKYIRTMILEMARIGAYLLQIASSGSAIGNHTVAEWAVGDRDLLLDIFEWITGARVYHIYQLPGGVRKDLPEGVLEKLWDYLDYLEKRIPDYDYLLFENPVALNRWKGTIVVTPEEVEKFGLSGPPAKAAGVAIDVRKDSPYEAYPELEFDIPVEFSGDAYARMRIVRREILLSISLLRQIINRMPKGEFFNRPPNFKKWVPEAGETYQSLESSRGEYAYYAVFDGKNSAPRRVYVKGPSYATGTSFMEYKLKGERLENIPVFLTTFNICPPEIDR